MLDRDAAAIYDIDLAVLERPEYPVLRDQRSPREQSVLLFGWR